MAAKQTIIELQNISVSFSQKERTVDAVKDVSLSVNQGDAYGIIGYSEIGRASCRERV